MGHELGQGHEVTETVRRREGHRTLQRHGLEHDIAVGEEEPRAARPARALVHRVVLSKPARGQILDVKNRQSGVLRGEGLKPRPRVVLGPVVHRHDLEIGIVLGE